MVWEFYLHHWKIDIFLVQIDTFSENLFFMFALSELFILQTIFKVTTHIDKERIWYRIWIKEKVCKVWVEIFIYYLSMYLLIATIYLFSNLALQYHRTWYFEIIQIFYMEWFLLLFSLGTKLNTKMGLDHHHPPTHHKLFKGF